MVQRHLPLSYPQWQLLCQAHNAPVVRRRNMLGNFKFTILLGCKDTETQEYFSKMIGDKPSFGDDENKNNRPIIRPAELAHLEQDLYVICDDGAVRLRKNFYFKS